MHTRYTVCFTANYSTSTFGCNKAFQIYSDLMMGFTHVSGIHLQITIYLKRFFNVTNLLYCYYYCSTNRSSSRNRGSTGSTQIHGDGRRKRLGAFRAIVNKRHISVFRILWSEYFLGYILERI